MASQAKKELKPFPLIKLMLLALVSKNSTHNSTIAILILKQDESLINKQVEGSALLIADTGLIEDGWSPNRLKLKSAAWPELRKTGDIMLVFLKGSTECDDKIVLKYETIPVVTKKILMMLRATAREVNYTGKLNIELLI
jgi:hypothetical protein